MSKEKKKGSCLKTVLVVIVALVILGAIGSTMSKDDDKVKDVTAKKEETTPTEKEEPNSEEPETEEKTEFTLGETAEQKGIQITLLSATESSGNEYITPDEGNIFLLCEFDIANNSDKDINISSIACFEAYCDDYSINQDLIGLQAPEAEGKNQLDGSLGPSSACGKLIPTRNMEACLHLFSAPDARKEAAWVADQVALLLGGTSHTLEDSRRRDATLATPCSPGEVAVLVRMKALIPPLKTALERRGVPCSAPETAPFWGDPSAALILELAGLRFQRPFAAPEGPGSLDVDVPQLAASLPEQLWQAGPSALASHLDAAKLLAPLFTESAACNALLRAFREQGKTWEGLLDWVCLRQDLDLVREQAEQVQIMTLHAAKGLEFRAVFLPALEEGILPFPGADALLHGDPGGAIDPDALAEERRLFYVGLTRAQDAVFVSHAAQRHLYGKALELPPSRFLSALPELFRHTRLVRHVQTKATQMKLF